MALRLGNLMPLAESKRVLETGNHNSASSSATPTATIKAQTSNQPKYQSRNACMSPLTQASSVLVHSTGTGADSDEKKIEELEMTVKALVVIGVILTVIQIAKFIRFLING